MKNVLVTGLAIGNEFGICQVCNVNYKWLICNPSTLAWADKILIPESIWKDIISCKSGENIAFSKALKLVFEFAKSKGIVQLINPSEIIVPPIKIAIFKEIEKDWNIFIRRFPNYVEFEQDKDRHPTLKIDNQLYCLPYVWHMYASLILARVYDAQCFFDDPILKYFDQKLSINTSFSEKDRLRLGNIFPIYESYIPNTPLFPDYTLDSKSCPKCKNKKDCMNDGYLKLVEKEINKIFSWRNYDEIQQIKDEVDSIVKKIEGSKESISLEEIANELSKKRNNIQKRIRSVFPKINRWSNITTIVSVPVIVAGVISTNPFITIAGATLTGLSKIAKETVELLNNKYRWTGFIAEESKHPIKRR